MLSQKTQILIVGAGPTGLALACRCRQLGLDIRLIEQKPGPSTTSKAIGLQYRVSEMLALLGVVDRFQERGKSGTAVNVYANNRHLLQFSFAGLGRQVGRGAFEPQAIILPQCETEEILGELLGELEGQIEWNTAFLSFHQTGKKVAAQVRRPDGALETIEADYLVSCEGAHSIIRKQAGIDFSGKTYPLLFLLADVRMPSALNSDQVHAWMHPHGTIAAMPLPGGVWRWFLEMSQEADTGEESEEATWRVVQRVVRERVPEMAEVASGEAVWISRFRIHCRVADHYRSGRVFLAGDAAHIHSPNGGQGITTGVQDAMNLAWKLARVLQGAPGELLDTYEEERRPHALEVLRETDRVTSLTYATRPPLSWLRDWILLPLLRQRWFQRRMFGRFAQLHISYRGCRLARNPKGRWFGVRDGDRAPDIVFRDAVGEQVTLLDLLRPGRPVLLLGLGEHRLPRTEQLALAEALREQDIGVYFVCSRAAGDAHQGDVLVDHHGDLLRLYGLHGEFACLLRPDDHVGLIQDRLDRRALAEYLPLLGARPSRASLPAGV
jgi:4,5-epoxidase